MRGKLFYIVYANCAHCEQQSHRWHSLAAMRFKASVLCAVQAQSNNKTFRLELSCLLLGAFVRTRLGLTSEPSPSKLPPPTHVCDEASAMLQCSDVDTRNPKQLFHEDMKPNAPSFLLFPPRSAATQNQPAQLRRQCRPQSLLVAASRGSPQHTR